MEEKPVVPPVEGVATAMITVITNQKALTGRPSVFQALMPLLRFFFNWSAGSVIVQSFYNTPNDIESNLEDE